MKIKSFQQACKLLKINEKTALPNVSKLPKHMQASTVARVKLEIITEASRCGVELDYDNTDERKWYAWFWLNKPGFRFDGTGYGVTYAGAGGGPRLCFLSQEDAEWHAKKYLSLYKDMMTMPPKKVAKKAVKKK